MRPLRSALPLVLALAASAPAEEPVQVRLGPKLTRDAALHFEQNQEATFDVKRGSASQSQATRVDRVFTVRCTSAEEAGGGTVEVTFPRIRGAVVGTMGRLDFDSDRPPPPANPSDPAGGPAAVIHNFVGLATVKLTAPVAANGKFGDVAGLEALPERARVGASGAGAAKDCLQGVFVKTTDQPVAAGATWTERLPPQEPLPGIQLVNTMTYRVTAIDAETVTLAFDGVVARDEPAPPAAEPAKDASAPSPPAPPEKKPRTPRDFASFVSAMKLAKGEVKGVAKLSRKDGMALEFTSATSIVFEGVPESPTADSRVASTVRTHVIRKAEPKLDEKPQAPQPPAPPPPPAPPVPPR